MMVTAGETRRAALAALRAALAGADSDTSDLDARILLTRALGIDAAALLREPDLPLGEDGAARVSAYGRRRLAGEPVGRILGEREFWGLPFRLSPGTLEPRPDTETVVAAALARCPDRAGSASVLDIGTGSGCILVALLSERPQARGIGTDRSRDALATARRNAAANGVAARASFVACDWAGALRGPFDVVVSNPPYIRAGDIAGLAPEVARHDPRAALDGGPDGLAAYRAILADLPRLLAPGGTAILEIGHDQAEAVRALAAGTGLEVREVVRDLGGRDRVAVLGRSG